MAKSFLKTEMIEAFLSEIDRKYGLLELNRMMNCLYVGHGQLDSILRHQFGINLAADEREFELCRRRSILQDVR